MAKNLDSAKQKFRGNNATPFKFDALPNHRSDPLWSEIRSEYGLISLAELSALQNAPCQQSVKKKNSKREIKKQNQASSFISL
jgi:hypothetical protein